MIGQLDDFAPPAVEPAGSPVVPIAVELSGDDPSAVSIEAETTVPAVVVDAPALAAPALAAPVAPPAPKFIHPCHITFKGMDPTEAVRVEVRAWLDRLGPLTTSMIGGQVVVEAVDEGRRDDRRYHVRMELTMPEGVVTVGPDHPSNGAHEDVYVAVRNAFRAARRQLEVSIQARPPEAPTARP
jgi:ribosome-associated translation inhibitor RaiA